MPRKKVAFDTINILYHKGVTVAGLPKGPVKLLSEDADYLYVQEVKQTGRVKIKVTTKTTRIPQSLIKAIFEEEVTVDGEPQEAKAAPAKRRGRPPKAAARKTPAKRGRPKKKAAAKKVAAKRGRPKKKAAAKKTVAKKRGRPKGSTTKKKASKKKVAKKKVAKKKTATKRRGRPPKAAGTRKKRKVKKVSDGRKKKRTKRVKRRRAHLDLLGNSGL